MNTERFMKPFAGGLLACLLLILGLAIALTVRMERHIRVAAEPSDTEWTLYFKGVPGKAVRYRAPGTAAYVDAAPDRAHGQWDMGRVRRPAGPAFGKLLVELEYKSWMGQRHTWVTFDATRWQANQRLATSGYPPPEWGVVEAHAGAKRIRFNFVAEECLDVEYSLDSETFDQKLAYGATTLDVPMTTRYFAFRFAMCAEENMLDRKTYPLKISCALEGAPRSEWAQ